MTGHVPRQVESEADFLTQLSQIRADAAARQAARGFPRSELPIPSLKHPACGSAVESLPQAGPVSPIRTGGTHR